MFLKLSRLYQLDSVVLFGVIDETWEGVRFQIIGNAWEHYRKSYKKRKHRVSKLRTL